MSKKKSKDYNKEKNIENLPYVNHIRKVLRVKFYFFL